MVDVVVVGCGGRGQAYAAYAKEHPDEMRISAIAEPKFFLRDKMKKEYGVPEEHIYSDYHALFEAGKQGNAIIIATQDNDHVVPAMLALEAGYRHLMVEKPIDGDLEECKKLCRKAEELSATVQICHSLRFAPFYRKMKELLDSGVIGEIKHINQEEGVGYYHYAHSFVRGDWANEAESSPMILAKCCHDMDILLYLTGSHYEEISSYGEGGYFSEANAPEGSAFRCVDCAVRETCPYDAIRIYSSHDDFYPLAVDKEGFSDLETAMKEGRYGRCVYHCDNTVVDHQSVNIRFRSGQTATLTMTAFTEKINRETRIMGTRGELVGDMEKSEISVYPFLGEPEVYHIKHADSNHAGADTVLMQDFLKTVRGEAEPCTPIQVSIESHEMCHAAEHSRKGQEEEYKG